MQSKRSVTLRSAYKPSYSIRPVVSSVATIDYESFADWHSWQNVRLRDDARFKQQWLVRLQGAEALRSQEWIATCSLCHQKSHFRDASSLQGEDYIREALICPSCGINARARAALSLLCEDLSETSRIYLTEQSSASYKWCKQFRPKTQGSEYLPSHQRQKSLLSRLGLAESKAVEHQDITSLTFPNDSFDAIGCFDVLEHVPNYIQALREFRRCLRPGGRLVVSVPFMEISESSLVRARIKEDGDVEHILHAEYHGDPVGEKILCFYHFGWDLLDTVRAAGFSSANWIRLWSPQHALLGIWIMRAQV